MLCPWCCLRNRLGVHLRPGRLWALWRRGRYCRLCAPPRESRAGRLAIAHNAIITEVRRLRDDVRAASGDRGEG